MIKVFHNEPLVRTRSYLMQNSCLNQLIIQTRFYLLQDPVRISLSFGLISHLLQDSCPYQLIIQTRFSFITGDLSVSTYHSDSFLIYCRIPVRISLSFRLVSHLLQETCPYQPIIQTRFAFIAGFLSELAYHSDPFLIYYRIPV